MDEGFYMTDINKVELLKFNARLNDAEKTKNLKKEYKIFDNDGDYAPIDYYNYQGGPSDWNSNLTTEYSKLGLSAYTWTKINDFNDAAVKSQDNLIDVRRSWR